MAVGHELGLIDDDTLKELQDRKKQIDREIQRVKQVFIKPTAAVNEYLQHRETTPIRHGTALEQLLKRTELDYEMVKTLSQSPDDIPKPVARQVEIEVKYEGYIQKQLREIERFKNMEKIKIPVDFQFSAVHGLSNELKEKLASIKPTSIGQVSRIEGITPAAISVLMVALSAAEKQARHL
jgi:tRNA uridine 5-carboxymethylaminomethyl modification enzyme